MGSGGRDDVKSALDIFHPLSLSIFYAQLVKLSICITAMLLTMHGIPNTYLKPIHARVLYRITN